MTVVEVRDMVKTYNSVPAVDGVSFSVEKGWVFGLLGPNGAGKTTIIESLVGLRRPDSGTLSVLGNDPVRSPAAVRERVGVQLQVTSLFPRIRVEEAMNLFAALYPRVQDPKGLLKRVGLEPKRKAMAQSLSGGEKQRLALALALINDPELVFLDEPSAGVDPLGRRAIWEIIRELRSSGKTVFLTTHLMDEAEKLCDEVLFLDRGKCVAKGPPSELISGREAQNLDDLYVKLMQGSVT